MASLNQENPDIYQVQGSEKGTHLLRRALARSFSSFLEHHSNDEIQVVSCYDLTDTIEAIWINFPTGTHQEPAHDVRPIEPLLVLFANDGAPLIASLRPSFPFTQHTFGLELGAPTDAQLALCIDDRVWEDAAPDYNGAELARRIAAWFQRAISGNMNDELQFQDPVFLPSLTSIVVGIGLEKQVLTQDPFPVFLALTSGDEGSKTHFAYPYNNAPNPKEGKVWTPFLALSLVIKTNNTGAMWRAPSCLGELNDCVSGPDYDLMAMLREQLSGLWATLDGEERARLNNAHLIIHIVIKNNVSDRIETFWLLVHDSVANIAVDFGIVAKTEGEEGDSFFVVLIPTGDVNKAALLDIQMSSANLFHPFGPEYARQMSGLPQIGDHAAIVGSGSIGSQIAIHLVREGAFDRLTLIDDDRLLPHNVSRHLLTSTSVSRLKSLELAQLIEDISPGFSVTSVGAKLGSIPDDVEFSRIFSDAYTVFDLTASVGASREISDRSERGRAVSAFFNPLGTSYAVLVEDRDQACDLAAIEASYYAAIVHNSDLADHLSDPNRVVVSSGRCRSVSNRLSSTDAALLSAAASKSIRAALCSDAPSLTIGSMHDDGSLEISRFEFVPSSLDVEHSDWTVRMSGSVDARLRATRGAALPNETGGVLLGIVDYVRKRIEVALALPAPPDSQHAPTEFLRGVEDLQSSIDLVSKRVMHQLTYIGEWHSHPRGAFATPSSVDRGQLMDLAENLVSENRPGVMVIVGEHETRMFGQGNPAN